MSRIRRGRVERLVLSALALVIAGGALTACGGQSAEDQRLAQEQLDRARAEGRREAQAEQRTNAAVGAAKRLRRDLQRLKRERLTATKTTSSDSAPSAPSGGGTTSCGDGLSVNGVTSCSFARSVKDEYESSGGASVLSAYSPVTGQTYTMRCGGGMPVVCTGGNNAAVYIR